MGCCNASIDTHLPSCFEITTKEATAPSVKEASVASFYLHYSHRCHSLDFQLAAQNLGCSKLKYQRLAVAPSQRKLALARTIVCCGASIVAHFARKVRATNT